jgi:hypothetical protein
VVSRPDAASWSEEPQPIAAEPRAASKTSTAEVSARGPSSRLEKAIIG